MANEAPQRPTRARLVGGWAAVVVATAFACLWAFWGIIENFHEGWYHPSLGRNLAMMFGQYLVFPLLFAVATAVAIRWPWVGGGVFLAAGGWAGWFFRGASPLVLYPFLVAPLAGLGLLFLWGRPWPRRWALAVAAGLPLLTLVVSGAEPAWRVAHRHTDGHRGERLVEGNGVRLVWAPEGPGWSVGGEDWDEAVSRCRHLTADGLSLADAPQDVWRLPTADEVVRSSCRHGRNAGGEWDGEAGWARFAVRPDKEPPLWDGQSKVIYWWTATEAWPNDAARVSYNGHVMWQPKSARLGYLGFRAVRGPGAR